MLTLSLGLYFKTQRLSLRDGGLENNTFFAIQEENIRAGIFGCECDRLVSGGCFNECGYGTELYYVACGGIVVVGHQSDCLARLVDNPQANEVFSRICRHRTC